MNKMNRNSKKSFECYAFSAVGIVALLLALAGMAGAATNPVPGVYLLSTNPSGVLSFNAMATDGTNLYVNAAMKDGTQHIFRYAIPATPQQIQGTDVYTLPKNTSGGSNFNPAGMAILGSKLYCVDPNSGPVTDTQIYYFPKDGGGPLTAIYTGANVGQPIVDGVGLTTDGTKLYVTDCVGGTTWSINTDGSNLKELGGSRYAADFPDENVTFAAWFGGTIYMADLGQAAHSLPSSVLEISAAGGAVTTFYSAPVATFNPTAIAVAGASSSPTLYIADTLSGGSTSIMSMPAKSGAPTVYASDSTFGTVCGNGLLTVNGNLYAAGKTSAGGPGLWEITTNLQSVGGLQVTLTPAAAEWNVDGGAWQNSGATVSGLSLGTHTINYNTVPGWTPPPACSVTITCNKTVPVIAIYSQQTGGLQVTLAPAAAANAGAQWNVDSGAWQKSGVTVSGLAVGSHTINFNSIYGWTSPASAPVTISYNKTATATGTYVLQTGSLTVNLLPSAVTASAQWQVDGGAWQSSGATVPDLPIGSHVVNYLQLKAWASPLSETVTVHNNQNTSVTRTYVADNTPPSVTGLIPASGAWNASTRTPIQLHITDSGSGMDPKSIVISAGLATTNGSPASYETIYSGATATADAGGWCSFDANANTFMPGTGYCVGSTRADCQFLFQRTTPFEFEDRVFIQVNASDLAGNAMPTFTYSFEIEGISFGCDVKVDGGTAGNSFPAMAADAQGNIWVAWERTDASTQMGTIWLAMRTADGCNFGSEIQVTSVAQNGDCHKPAIAISSGGMIFVAYEVHGATPVIGIATASTAAPTVWTSAGLVTSPIFTLQTAPAIVAVDSTSLLYVAGVGTDINTGLRQVGVATAIPTGGIKPSWGVTELAGVADEISPSIAKDANGIVYVVWTNKGDNNLYGADSTGWATIHQVTNSGNAGSPAIATEATGNLLHFVWVDNSGSNPNIFYAETTGGWAGTPLTGASVLDGTTGIYDAALPRIAVTGTTSSSTNAGVYIVWQDRRLDLPNFTDIMTDIMFVERDRDGQFGTNIYLSCVPLTLGIIQNAADMNPALGVTASGMPYATWTDQTLISDIAQIGKITLGPSHIEFVEAMDAQLCGGQPSPVQVTPGAPGQGTFADPTNPHFTKVDVTVGPNAFTTPRDIAANELRNPVTECPGGSKLFADGSGLYLDITGGIDQVLNDWVTITIHLAPGAKLPSPLAVYRLVPPATPADNWTWTTAYISNVNYNAAAGVLTFQTMHLSSFGVGPASANGGSGGGGCSMSPNGQPDIFILLLPLVALGFWAGTRLIGKKRSANA